MLVRALIGAAAALIVAFAAYRLRALSRSGAIAAWIVGTITYAIGGWPAAFVLFAFFIPSSLLSRFGKAEKRALVDVDKHGARDAWQVFSNGGVAAIALLFAPRDDVLAFAAFAGAFAAASADTWGTEIGTLAGSMPRSLFTLQRVPAGMSGGITWQGTLAELGGAAIVALTAALLHLAPFAPVMIAGVAGAFLDSALGATLQALRYCPACRLDCETNPHVCGTATTVRRGFAWFENDAVNLSATICGAIVAMLFALR